MKELNRYKEELAVIGLLSLVLLLLRWFSASVWPTTGQYDLAAQTETVFFVVLRLVIYSLAAWMGLRVVAPKVYTHLKHRLIDKFDALEQAEQNSLALRFYAILFFGLIGLAVAGAPTQPSLSDPRTCVVAAAAADVGVREATGRNDGPAVDRYLAHVGLGKGYAWCAAFVSYHLDGCGVKNPRSAWSPAFATASDRVWTPRKASRSPLPGDVFSIYYASLKRVGHVGLVVSVDGRYINTVEGNTSGPGSREGDGVYARRRELSKIHAVTSYIEETPRDPGATRTGGLRDGRVQTQAASRANDRHGHARGSRAWCHAARHDRAGTCCPGERHHAAASVWLGPTTGDGALGSCLQHGERAGRFDQTQRWVRHDVDQGQALRSMEQGAAVTAAHRYARGAGDRGSDRDPHVGVVGAGVRPGRTGSAALATAPQVHLLTIQPF